MNGMQAIMEAFRDVLTFPGWLLVKLGLAQNRITASIGASCALMIVAGIALMFVGSMTIGAIGLVMACLGVLDIAVGWTTFPVKPLTKGMLTIWGKPYTVGGKDGPTIALAGNTILADYWPFFVGAVPINMTRKEWKFEMEVVSVKGTDAEGRILPSIPINGVIEMTVFPLETELDDYNASGEMEAIEKQMGKIPYQVIQSIVKDHKLTFVDISQNSTLLTDLLKEHMNGANNNEGAFQEKSWGIKALNVRGDFPLPDDIKEAMLNSASIIYESEARQEEYAADLKAIDQFKKLGLEPEKALNAYSESRLIRDGRVDRLQIESKGTTGSGAIIVRDMQVRTGGNQGRQGQNQGDRKNRRQNRQGGSNQNPSNQNPTTP